LLSSEQFKRHRLYSMDKRALQSSRESSWFKLGFHLSHSLQLALTTGISFWGTYSVSTLNKHSFCMFYSLSRAVNLRISPMYVQPNDSKFLLCII
jgi:hypothetical protein